MINIQSTDTKHGYPYSIKQLIASLRDYKHSDIMNDVEHISTKHTGFMPNCSRNNCIHLRRNQESKQELYGTNDWQDYPYIALLDRAHCVLKHRKSRHSLRKSTYAMKSINRYANYPIYSYGIEIKYESLSPIYTNLKSEITMNELFFITNEQFETTVQDAKAAKKEIGWIASNTSVEHGIEEGDEMGVEYIVAIKLYCNDSGLCTAFRRSYRSENGKKDSEEVIRKRHIENFYWLGRYLMTAIKFWGKSADSKDKQIYHGVDYRFLFNSFSTIFWTPTSTSIDYNVTSKFNGDGAGITLQLSPKFTDKGYAKYLPVAALSDHKDEMEYLVE